MYTLVYGLDGQVDETQPYACRLDLRQRRGDVRPLNLLEVVETRWQGHNPYVTEANVRSLDMANGGGYAGSPRAARQLPPGRAPTRPAAPRCSSATRSRGRP